MDIDHPDMMKVGDLIDTEDTGEIVVLNPKDSPLAMMIREQEQKRGPSEQITPKVRWLEDKLIPMRWYHIRWQWLQLQWILWREGRAPFTGILCPLLGRHWYEDWRGFALVFDSWDIEWFKTYMKCYHCGQDYLIKSTKNLG